MKDAYSIIKRPLITEKSMNLTAQGKYAFEVDPDANKIEIARAVEEIFGVEVVKVNTINVKPKRKRLGRFEGTTGGMKKAYVTLKPGQRIQIFEGA
ncbi:MAG: 50S ribosomal protein L23 [Armatimonadota bacterium]|nr:50S ribosomal protein L23 [Armatimonadota bacterium]